MFKRTNLPGNYPGTKTLLMKRILPYIPSHKHFCVLFGGIGGEICSKPKHISLMESMNDVNADNINAFRILKKEPKRLIKALLGVPYSEEWFYGARELLVSGKGSDFERAEAWWTVSGMNRGFHDPTCRHRAAPSFTYTGNKNVRKWERIDEILSAVCRRFRRVQLWNRDWQWLVDRLDRPDTCFAVDPPYLPEVRNSVTPMYTFDMTKEEHEEMLLRLRRIKGKAIVFHYSNPLYEALLGDWQRMEFSQRVQVSPRTTRPMKTEVVWFKP